MMKLIFFTIFFVFYFENTFSLECLDKKIDLREEGFVLEGSKNKFQGPINNCYAFSAATYFDALLKSQNNLKFTSSPFVISFEETKMRDTKSLVEQVDKGSFCSALITALENGSCSYYEIEAIFKFANINLLDLEFPFIKGVEQLFNLYNLNSVQTIEKTIKLKNELNFEIAIAKLDSETKKMFLELKRNFDEESKILKENKLDKNSISKLEILDEEREELEEKINQKFQDKDLLREIKKKFGENNKEKLKLIILDFIKKNFQGMPSLKGDTQNQLSIKDKMQCDRRNILHGDEGIKKIVEALEMQNIKLFATNLINSFCQKREFVNGVHSNKVECDMISDNKDTLIAREFLKGKKSMPIAIVFDGNISEIGHVDEKNRINHSALIIGSQKINGKCWYLLRDGRIWNCNKLYPMWKCDNEDYWISADILLNNSTNIESINLN